MPPFVFDIATTQVAGNKIAHAHRIGSEIMPGWLARKDGTPLMEQQTAPAPGTYFMLPFGGLRENGGHKGYGFAVIVDIMAGILSGNGPGFAALDKYSHFFMAFNIEAFVDPGEFKDDMDRLLEKLVNTRPAPGHERVLYAGLPESEEYEARLQDGIPYHREVVDWYNSVSAELELGYRLP
jgi:LDH2 family malate/lactate/ureidoglycolate dehydrogenase